MARRALLVTPLWPNPNGAGTPRRAYQHLWCLSRDYVVDLVVQPRNATPQPTDEMTRSLCDRIVELPVVDFNFSQILPGRRHGSALLHEVLQAGHRQWLPYRKPRLPEVISHLTPLSDAYAVFFAFRLDTAWMRQIAPQHQRALLDLDDLDSSFMLQEASRSSATRGRELTLVTKLRATRLKRVERQLLRSYDIVTFASPNDVTRSMGIRPIAHVDTLKNATLPTTDPLPPRDADGFHSILFVGYMNYAANADGATFFAREVLPLLRSKVSKPIKLYLVGKDPTKEVLALHSLDNVAVTGWVEDILPFYRNADLAIVPLRMGSGTRIKAIEAMNLGRPLVSTSLGVEGLGLDPGHHVLIADTAENFADAAARLLSDPELWRTLVKNGRQKVIEDLGYAQAHETLHRLLLAEHPSSTAR